MSTSLWIVMVIVVAWTSFLIGYGVSALTAVKQQPAAEVSAPGGGYGAAREGAPAAAGGYGEAKSRGKSPAGGYGEARPGSRAPAGGYGAPAGDSAGSRKRYRSEDSSSD
ncbi:MAG: hypothetical protein A2X52_03025 [Candidatus Rokubacteria bacterium GWC2_70_16]|nr:MAG: hypothetical protein A2X52_03025 [Candidatus Rokubacteria bacterium GWC2_70_16]OGL19336.1 MAG: hypothetical protein A3K12_03885 [Candidatus Rokubacteria bacterium RIFCSPLOWO2_12_FULL_71_19]